MWAALAAATILLHAPADPGLAPSRIVFASARTTVPQLYSVEPSGDGLAQLTFGKPGFEAPVLSPNGRFIAALRNQTLWVMRADGTEQRRLGGVAVNAVSWSANSRQIVYSDSGGAIWTVARVTGRSRHVTSGQWPSLSPDGRAIAFVRCCDPEGRSALVVRRHGLDRTVMDDVFGGPSWSPNGRWIAIEAQQGSALEVIRASGAMSHRRVASMIYCSWCGPGGPAWSPDGRFLAFVDAEGLHVIPRSGGAPTLEVEGFGGGGGIAWSPDGKALAVPAATVRLDGKTKTLLRLREGEALPGIGWGPAQPAAHYRPPEPVPMLAQVSPRELEARYPIRQISADGDRVGYWVCPHALGIWRPGDTQPIPLGERTLQACLAQSDTTFEPLAYELALAGDRLAYLWTEAGNEVHTTLMLASVGRGTEGVRVDEEARPSGEPGPPTLTDVVGGGSLLFYGSRGTWWSGPAPFLEATFRIDGERPVRIPSGAINVHPLGVDQGRFLVRDGAGTLELLDLDGWTLAAHGIRAITARLAGDDLVVLAPVQLRNYSASTGDLRDVWPLPDVRSSGRCLFLSCDGDGVRLRLVDAARGLALYSLDGTFHLLRLRDGADATIPRATAAELTDAGLFYAYLGAEPWPGRIRFVPFADLPV
jgi:WD40-like Beta Propeller Repeat